MVVQIEALVVQIDPNGTVKGTEALQVQLQALVVQVQIQAETLVVQRRPKGTGRPQQYRTGSQEFLSVP